MGLSENSVPLFPMVLLIIIPIKWPFHWEYTQHFQTNSKSTAALFHPNWQATTPRPRQGTYVLPGGFGKDEYQRLEGLGESEKYDQSPPNCHMAVRKPQ